MSDAPLSLNIDHDQSYWTLDGLPIIAKGEKSNCQESRVGSRKMDDARCEALPDTTPCQKGKRAFDRGTGFKTINFDGNVSSIDSSVCRGRVSDRKKFFEQLSSSPSPARGPSAPRHSVNPSIIEERTDSESYSQIKKDNIEKERKPSANVFQDKSERVGPAESLPTQFNQKWETEVDPSWDIIEPNDSEWETHHDKVPKEESYSKSRNELNNSIPTMESVKNDDILGANLPSLTSIVDADTKETSTAIEKSRIRDDGRQRDEGDARVQLTSSGQKPGDEVENTKKEPKLPKVKIQITRKIANGTGAEEESKMNEEGENENLATSWIQDINELTKVLNFGETRERSNISNYVCPSESTDDSVDSEGNLRATKNSSSNLTQRLKTKSNGMGKMLRMAKKGMGKSVKNLTSIVRNTRKTQSTKQSRSMSGQSGSVHSTEKKSMEIRDIFDEKLAKELVKDCRDEAGIVMASQYLDSGNKLLRNVASDDGVNPKCLNEATKKAHTYAYVGRQLAKEYLLTCDEEQAKRAEINMGNSAILNDNDEMNLFDEFFYSFMQCFGSLAKDDDVERTRVQIGDALELLSKLSDEESTVVKTRLSREGKRDILTYRKKKVEGAIAGTRDSADRNHILAMDDADRERSFVIQSFVAALKSFYEIDDTLKLSKIFLAFDEDKSDDSSEGSGSDVDDSHPYNYTESLKFDHGRGFHTRSFLSSTEEGNPSSSHDDSNCHGINSGMTVVKVMVNDKKIKQKKQQSSNHTSKKWKPVGGRKQK